MEFSLSAALARVDEPEKDPSMGDVRGEGAVFGKKTDGSKMELLG